MKTPIKFTRAKPKYSGLYLVKYENEFDEYCLVDMYQDEEKNWWEADYPFRRVTSSLDNKTLKCLIEKYE